MQTHRFDVSIDDAVRTLLNYDSQVISSASNAFLAYSKRDGFDEGKRTFPYFVGIVKNKQQELDASRVQTDSGILQTQRLLAQLEANRRQVAKEAEQERQALRTRPEQVILQYAEMLLAGRLHFLRKRSLEGLRRGLKALRDLGRATLATLESLKATIQGWGKHSEELKRELLSLLAREFELAKSA